MYISELSLKNIKNFNTLNIKFNDELNIFVGPNGCGKSNLLNIINILFNYFIIPNKGLRDEVILQRKSKLRRLVGDEQDKSRLSVKIKFNDEYIKKINNCVSITEFECSWLCETQGPIGYEKEVWKIVQSCEEEDEKEFEEKKKIFVEYLKIFQNQNKPSFLYFNALRSFTIKNMINYDICEASKLKVKNNEMLSYILFYLFHKEDEGEIYVSEDFADFNDILKKYFGYIYDHEHLQKRNYLIPLRWMSSGQQQILSYFLSICFFNIRNSIVIIDEPELYLHPIWRQSLIEALMDIRKLTNNQFIFSTHSSEFITYKTISYVKRMNLSLDYYTDIDEGWDNEGNRWIRGMEMRHYFEEGSIESTIGLNNFGVESKHLIDIIKSQNNEKIFFSSKILLVEGVSDYLFFKKLLEEESNILLDISIINVDGKEKFKYYAVFLENFNIPYKIIADKDFIKDGVNKYFSFISKIYDNKSVIDKLNTLKSQNKFESSESAKAFQFLYENNIFVLKKGEIEDYTEENKKDKISSMLAFINSCTEEDKNILNKIKDINQENFEEIEECLNFIKGFYNAN